MNEMIYFDLPYPQTKSGKSAWNKRFGLNAYWAGKHYRLRSKDADEIHILIRVCLKKFRLTRYRFNVPVSVTFYWDDGLDCDNHAALGKMMLDAIVRAKIIPNDNRKWVKSVNHKFWKHGKMRVVISEVTDEEEN